VIEARGVRSRENDMAAKVCVQRIIDDTWLSSPTKNSIRKNNIDQRGETGS